MICEQYARHAVQDMVAWRRSARRWQTRFECSLCALALTLALAIAGWLR